MNAAQALVHTTADGLTPMQRWRKNHPELAKERGRKESQLQRERHPEKIQAARVSPSGRWPVFVSKATARGIDVSISFAEWCDLVIEADCHYCGRFIDSKGSSLDRKDSNLGYSSNNVVPCCADCNKVKNDVLTYDEMCYFMPLLMTFRNRE